MPTVTTDYLGCVPAIDGPLRVVPVATEQYYGPANRSVAPVNVTSVITEATLRIDVTVDPGLFSPDLQNSICGTVRGELERLAYLQPLTAQPSPGARQVFFVHPAVTETHWCRDLANALGPAVDCHALGAETAPHALDEDELAALAARYVQRIREIQPSGPYRLAGSNTGGVIAFAMALRLQDDNQTVERLVLIAPPPRDRLGLGLIVPAVLTAHLIPLLPDAEPRRVHDAVKEALAAPREQRLQLLVDQLADGDAHLADTIRIILRLHDLMARWQPPGTIETLHIVHPDDPISQDTAAEWKLLGQHARTIAVPGDRRRLLSNQDALRTIADILTGVTAPPGDDPDGVTQA
jgi:thioesterase domain-containing protein